MWHLSMKLFHMIDQTPLILLTKLWQTCFNEKRSQSLTSTQRSRSLQKAKENNLGNKNMPLLKNGAGIPLLTDVQLICQQVMNALLTTIEVGQQRSRMTRLIIIIARFLASKSQFQLDCNSGVWLCRSLNSKF